MENDMQKRRHKKDRPLEDDEPERKEKKKACSLD
jgi:hypothetical protein